MAKPSILLTGLLAAVLLSGCSWFDWSDDSDSVARAQRVTAIQNASDAGIAAPQGETMADRRLRAIHQKQMALYERLAEEGGKLSDPEYDRLIQEVMTEYQSYLSDYPESVYGFILYGKMLRDVGDRTAANTAFVRANQLDENIAVVKQQIGNFMAEEGEPALALAYYLSAAELEPNRSVYAYQIGELLYTYHDEFIASGDIDQVLLEEQMQVAFAKAHELNPSNRQLTQRFAESYFDVATPDWNRALFLWQALEGSATDPVERDWARLQMARVMIKLGRTDEARQTLSKVSEPGLQSAREQLLSQIG